MEEQSALDLVKYEISEYLEYGHKFKSLDDFYKGVRNIIAFRLENHIYNFESADKALAYLDDFYRKQEKIQGEQNKVNEEYIKREDDEER